MIDLGAGRQLLELSLGHRVTAVAHVAAGAGEARRALVGTAVGVDACGGVVEAALPAETVDVGDEVGRAVLLVVHRTVHV
ncbi:MAG: hypothetical protein PVI52_06935, partial [Chromatiales bacterium]